MYLYHATKYENLFGIMRDGLKPGMDGLIYFTTDEQHSVNWIDMVNIKGEDLLVIRVDTNNINEALLDDGYDHSPTFYKGITVKTYSETIPFELIDDKIMKFISKNNPEYYNQ